MAHPETPRSREQSAEFHKREYLLGSGAKQEVQAHKDPNTLACGIANSSADRSARQVLVMLAYLNRRYIDVSDSSIDEEGAYKDFWESRAIPFVAKKGPHVVGSIRLIPKSPENGLPIHWPDSKGFRMEIDPPYEKMVKDAPFEVSQLAKSPKPQYGAERNITVAVIRSFIAHLQQQDQAYAVAAIDERVIKLLNGSTLRLGLPAIGPTRYFVGSYSTPVMVNIADMIESSKKASRKGLSDFLAHGKGVPGFEWYKGM